MKFIENKNFCKICASSSIKSFILNDKTYFFCKECNSIFLSEKFFLSKENQVKRYSLHNNSLDDEGYKNYLLKFFEKSLFLSKFSKSENSSFLDYGSGPVPCLCSLVENAKIFSSVDKYDLFYSPTLTKDKKYDFITCNEVIEHFENPKESFFHISSLLKPNGVLCLQTQFLQENDFSSQLDFFSKWWYIQDSTHVVFYTKKGLKKLCSDFGLEFIASEKNICVFTKKDF